MRRGRRPDGPSLRDPIACCLLAVVALSLGPTGEAAVRSAVRDAARPGFALRRSLSVWLTALDLRRWPWTEPVAERDPPTNTGPTPQLVAAERESRRLRAELAAARREIAALDRSFGPIRHSPSETTAVERIAVRLLDGANETTRPGSLLVGSGSSDQMATGQLAVEPPILTAGAEAGTPEGAVVLAGAAVVGRIDEVGVWTSTLLPVTHPEFRAHVWIVRASADGPESGEQGILEGDGRGGCVVRYVPSTAAVAVGDHVYSYDPTGRMPQPLYYGRIEHAELPEGAPHWEIRARPAADPSAFGEVHVLVPTTPEPPRPVTMAD